MPLIDSVCSLILDARSAVPNFSNFSLSDLYMQDPFQKLPLQRNEPGVVVAILMVSRDDQNEE